MKVTLPLCVLRTYESSVTPSTGSGKSKDNTVISEVPMNMVSNEKLRVNKIDGDTLRGFLKEYSFLKYFQAYTKRSTLEQMVWDINVETLGIDWLFKVPRYKVEDVRFISSEFTINQLYTVNGMKVKEVEIEHQTTVKPGMWVKEGEVKKGLPVIFSIANIETIPDYLIWTTERWNWDECWNIWITILKYRKHGIQISVYVRNILGEILPKIKEITEKV